MKNHLPGITISALVHAGLFTLAYTTLINKPVSLPVDKPEPITLKLSMFVPPPPPPEPVIVPPEPVVIPEPEPVAEVIKKPKAVPPKPIKKPRPKPKPKKQPRPEPVVKAEPEPVVEPEIIKPQPPPVVTAPPVDNRIIDEYKITVRKAIETNKRYPRKARRLRQQGTVTLGFTILRDGTIENLRIIQSAGNTSLDQAALKTIRKINGKFPIPAELNRTSWEFNVPMKYSLL